MNERIVLFSSHEQAITWRKQQARACTQGCFAVKAHTLSSFIEEAWQVHGNERRLVSPLQRTFALASLMESPDWGFIDLVATYIEETAGTRYFKEAAAFAEDSNAFCEGERKVFCLVAAYDKAIEAQGMLEPGCAWVHVAPHYANATFELQPGLQVPRVLRCLAEEGLLNVVGMDECSVSPLVGALPKDVEPSFLLAAGPSAEHALFAEEVMRVAQSAQQPVSVVLATAFPVKRFSVLSRELGAAGFAVSLVGQKRFCETDFGRAYVSLARFVLDAKHSSSAFLDFVSSPFSGIAPSKVRQIDAMVRGNRLLEFEELRALLRLTSPHYDCFEELLFDADASVVLGYFEDVANGLSGKTPAYCAEQQGAIRTLRRVFEAARVWGCEPACFTDALMEEPVSLSCTTGQDGKRGSVLVCSPSHAATLEPGSVTAVIVADLDDASFAAKSDHSALVTLYKKLDATIEDAALAQARRTFIALQHLAHRHFACHRTLTDSEGAERYPAFFFDEYLEASRIEDEPLDEYGVPEHYAPCVFTRGEEHFASNAAFVTVPSGSFELEARTRGLLSSAEALFPWAQRVMRDGAVGLALSPSALEAYVNCPYKWFVTYRLRPETLDEELGPLEQGTFVHAVFEAFQEKLQSSLGQARVTPENLEQAQALFGEVFDEVLALQPESQNGRFVPLDSVERAAAARLRTQLMENLELQAHAMRGFSPCAHELEITQDEGVVYAGVTLRGRVDRVDASTDVAQYAVIDYKGGIAGHDAGFDPEGEEEFALPSKIQSLIYAQALRARMEGRSPVAALYLNYRAKDARQLLAGSYSSDLFDAGASAHKKAEVNMNFERYLDIVEEAVESRVDQLIAGCIEPNPLSAQACTYCPVFCCERRLS